MLLHAGKERRSFFICRLFPSRYLPMQPLERTVYQTLSSESLLQPNSRLVVAVSGGPDSTALLHILARLATPLAVELVAVYVDHGLRPAEVPAEEQLVRECAGRLGLPWEVVRVATATEAVARKWSVEQAARELRYQALARIQEKYDAAALAVAHTADDQVEELLLRLLRGSSRKALSGMQVSSRGIIRPLLSVFKHQIYAYLEERQIVFCQDSSNRDPAYLRNRIRHQLLPLLEQEYDQGIRKALLKTAANLSEDEHYLAGVVEQLQAEVLVSQRDSWGRLIFPVQLDRSCLAGHHPALQRRFLESLLWEMGSAAQYEQIMALVRAAAGGRNGSELHLSRGLRVGISRDRLSFEYPRGRVAWRGSGR